MCMAAWLRRQQLGCGSAASRFTLVCANTLVVWGRRVCMYVFVYACVCVCEREREGERERERERESM